MVGWKLVDKKFMNKRTVREKYVLDPSETLEHATYLTPYYGARSNVTTKIENPSFATTLFTDTMKSAISSDNGVYASTTASAGTLYRYAEVAHRFVFDMSKFMALPNVLTKIEYGWDGYCDSEYGGVFVQIPTGWMKVRASLPTSDGSGFEFAGVLDSIIGVTIDKKFTFGVYGYKISPGETVTVTLNTDYVYVTVTYKITDLLNAPIIKPKVIGVSGYER